MQVATTSFTPSIGHWRLSGRPWELNLNIMLLNFDWLLRWREWEEIDGKLYCPDCVEYDKETDSYKPKEKEE